MIQIRYITGWRGGDPYLSVGSQEGGIWAQKWRGYAPISFDSEADAKQWLLRYKYDLPPLQVVFERVAQ